MPTTVPMSRTGRRELRMQTGKEGFPHQTLNLL